MLDENRHYFEAGRMKTLIHACSAGEPLIDSVIVKWKESIGREIYGGYGQTETILTCANQPGNPIKYGSMGKPVPGIPLVVVRSDGNVANPGEEGDIALEVHEDNHSFLGIFDGYIDSETGRVDRRLVELQKRRHYYFAGNAAYQDSEGYFWFVGREDDMINSSGYRIGEVARCEWCGSPHRCTILTRPQVRLRLSPHSSYIRGLSSPPWLLHPIPNRTKL